MRTLVTIASVVALAAGSVACDSSHQGSNNLIALPSIVSPTMLEAKGGNGNGKGNISPLPPTSLTLDMVYDYGTSGFSWGDSVSFTVSASEQWNQVNVSCYQNGARVYAAVWPLTPVLNFSSALWSSGAAECTAELISFGSSKPLASLSFPVAE